MLASVLIACMGGAVQTLATGVITTVAGNGTLGSSGDGGPATSAQLAYPTGIAIDSSAGTIYILNRGNNHLVRFNLDGSGATDLGMPGGLVASGASGIAVDPWASKLYLTYESGMVLRTDMDGLNAVNLTAQPGWGGLLSAFYAIALDSPPDLWGHLWVRAYPTPSFPAGGGFDWTFSVTNLGANPAVFKGVLFVRGSTAAQGVLQLSGGSLHGKLGRRRVGG